MRAVTHGAGGGMAGALQLATTTLHFYCTVPLAYTVAVTLDWGFETSTCVQEVTVGGLEPTPTAGDGGRHSATIAPVARFQCPIVPLLMLCACIHAAPGPSS